MATHHGNEGAVKVGTSTAVGEITDFTFTESADTAEDTSMGDVWKTFVPGHKEWSASITAHWDEADAGQLLLVLGTEVALKLYPEGATTGDTFRSGNAIVTSIVNKTGMNDIVEVTFEVKGTGALASSTAP
jgi:hypothetical protein